MHVGYGAVLQNPGNALSDAEVWRGAELLAPESERVRPQQGEYSHADLIGCEIWTFAGETPLGIVRGVEEFGGPPLLSVESPGGREMLIPFARAICREIDVARKMIRVVLPEGLAEL